MAEGEGAVHAELVVADSKEVYPQVKEAESEVAEGPEKGAADVVPVTADTEDTSAYKRKLEDLEPFENNEAPAKKQEIYVSEPATEQRSPITDELKAAPEVATEEIEIETGGSGYHALEVPVSVADAAQSGAAPCGSVIHGNGGEEHPRHDGEVDMAGPTQLKSEAEPVGNGQIPSTGIVQHTSMDDKQSPFPDVGQQDFSDLSISCKVEVPSNKVGVLIGKSGDTIRYLQLNSGAKIQITRDVNTDPHSSTRLVELIGTPENIRKAEQLIKDVLAESESGGSPSLVARGFSTHGGEQIEIQIPDEKVGVVIGKGGETIKNLQRKSGARIQLLPQQLPEGDSSKERTVRITGNKKQVESARELIRAILNQGPYRPSSLSGTYNQYGFRAPRGPPPAHQWPPRGTRPPHQMGGYDHQLRGMYPPPTTQYSQSYGGYPPPQQQLPPKGWDQQKSAAPPSQTPPSGGYDYYGCPTPSPHPSGSLPASMPAPVNYNYGHPQAPDGYGHPAQYAQPPPSQQNYGQVYGEPKYDGQPPQQVYGQPPAASPAGMNAQQTATPYGKPAYAAPHETPASYGQPRGPQPGDSMYQGPPPSQYPSSAPMQQPYPYGTGVPTQQAPPYGTAYGPTSAPSDAYSQQPPASYPPHGYSGQAAPPAYSQPAPQPGGYTQYPSSQAVYADQAAQANVNYGYQGGPSDAAYAGTVPSSGYAAPQPVPSQPVYSQPPSNPAGYYDPSNPPQSGYAAVPAAAPTPTTFANAVAAQPGYNGQYDASQSYSHH